MGLGGDETSAEMRDTVFIDCWGETEMEAGRWAAWLNVDFPVRDGLGNADGQT